MEKFYFFLARGRFWKYYSQITRSIASKDDLLKFQEKWLEDLLHTHQNVPRARVFYSQQVNSGLSTRRFSNFGS